MMNSIEKGVHLLHNYIVAKPIGIDFPPCRSTNVDIEVNSIAIRAVGQHPEFNSPSTGLVFDVLPIARVLTRLHHPLMNGDTLPRLIQTQVPRLEIINQGIYLTQFIPRGFSSRSYYM